MFFMFFNPRSLCQHGQLRHDMGSLPGIASTIFVKILSQRIQLKDSAMAAGTVLVTCHQVSNDKCSYGFQETSC